MDRRVGMGGVSGIPWPSKSGWCERNVDPDLYQEAMMCLAILDGEYMRWQSNETKKKRDKSASKSKPRRRR